MNRFLKIRALIALICIIIALCVVSVGIALRISLIMVEKKDNIIRARTGDSQTVVNDSQKAVEALNLNKAKRLKFYYNGQLKEEFTCYSDGNGQILLPLDLLLKELKIGYAIFNPDDIMKIDLPGRQLMIKLNSLDAKLGEEGIKLDAASTAFDNHVFVSYKILSCFDNYIQDMVVADNALFLNLWPAGLNKNYTNFRLLKSSGNNLESYTLFGNETPAQTINGITEIEGIYKPAETLNYLIKTESKFYMLDGSLKPRLLPVGEKALLSLKNRQIYWTDRANKQLYIYNVNDGKTKIYKNYFSRIIKNDSTLARYNKLYDFSYDNRFARFDLAGESENDIYTIIERNGKVVAEGKSHSSPDGKKLAYYVKDKGYYTSNADGTGIEFAGDGINARWVDNNRIIINTVHSMSVFDTTDKSVRPVDVDRVLAGIALNGDTFSIRDVVLYAGAGINAKQLLRLPWSCDYIYAPTGNSPFLILSRQKGRVFCFSGTAAFVAAETEKFINGSDNIGADEFFKANSAATPDNGKLAFLQNENELLQINLVDMKSFKLQKIVIESRFGEHPVSSFELLWLDNSKLLLHSANHGWILDLSSGTHIYSWEETVPGRVEGLLVK